MGEGSLAAAWKLLEEVLCGMECCKKYYIYVSWVHMWLGSAWFEHWRPVLGSSGPPPRGLVLASGGGVSDWPPHRACQ